VAAREGASLTALPPARRQLAARLVTLPYPNNDTVHERSQAAPCLVAARLPTGRQQLSPWARLRRLLPYAGSGPLGPHNAGRLGRRGATTPAAPARRPAAPEAVRRRIALDDAVEVHGFLRASHGMSGHDLWQADVGAPTSTAYVHARELTCHMLMRKGEESQCRAVR